jgi:pyridoxine 4-dehydrogenase
VHDNLRRLGLDVVYLRTLAGIDDRTTVTDALTPQLEALAGLRQQGLIRHLGVSTVSLGQLAGAQQIALWCPSRTSTTSPTGGRGGARGNG